MHQTCWGKRSLQNHSKWVMAFNVPLRTDSKKGIKGQIFVLKDFSWKVSRFPFQK